MIGYNHAESQSLLDFLNYTARNDNLCTSLGYYRECSKALQSYNITSSLLIEIKEADDISDRWPKFQLKRGLLQILKYILSYFVKYKIRF